MAALLEEPAVGGMRRLQPRQGRQRLGRTPQITLADGNHVEHVTVFRHLGQQRLRRAQRLLVAFGLHERTDPQHFRFNSGYRHGLHDVRVSEMD